MHVIGVDRDVFGINKKIAERNRKTFDEAGVLAINFMGAIGSGKTAMIEVLHKKLKGYKIAAIAGDIISDLDANRLKKLGIPVRRREHRQGVSPGCASCGACRG